MRRRFFKILIAIALLLALTACGTGGSEAYSDLSSAADGSIHIPTAEISRSAHFYNYDADGVTVQLVALRDQNDAVHIAFNTCQSCSPSPKAYYTQEGDVLKCTNCGFTFAPEEVGISGGGGCNPWPIDGAVIADDEITVPESSIEAMRGVFTTWDGPTK